MRNCVAMVTWGMLALSHVSRDYNIIIIIIIGLG